MKSDAGGGCNIMVHECIELYSYCKKKKKKEIRNEKKKNEKKGGGVTGGGERE